MKRWIAVGSMLCAAALAALSPATAQEPGLPQRCRVPSGLIDDIADFPNAARRVKEERRLVIVAIGAASTLGTGASTPASAWPARLADILAMRLSSVEVTVANLGQRGQTARIAVGRMADEVAPLKPGLVIWETGTVEAVRTEDMDQFPAALTEGMDLVAGMHADLILMDPQYARETERMINFQPYREAMRQTAGLPGVNLFPRHDIMRHWAENDQFVPATRAEMTRGNDAIYDCVAQLLAEVIDRGLRRAAHAAR